MSDVEGRARLGAQVCPRESDCVRVGVMLSINKSPRELSRTTRISRKDLFSHNYEALPFHLRYKRCRTGPLYSFFFSFSPSSKRRVTTRRFHISTQALQPFVITAECLQAEPPNVSILGLLPLVIVRQNIASGVRPPGEIVSRQK